MKNYKNDFTWFKNNKNLVFFDTAAGALKPDIVVKEINNFYHKQATNPHNDDSLFTHQAKTIMNECRKEAASLIHAKDEEIIFTSGATESLMLTAQSLRKFLKKDDEIILTKMEHASNLLPWYQLRDEIGIKIKFIESKNLQLDLESLKKILNKKTKIVSFTGGSNLTGIATDVGQITKIIKDFNKNIYVCVDLAQVIVHKECNVSQWDVDFAAFSGNKMFGPTGIGVCYIRKKLQELINPLKYGGGMNSTITENDFCYINGVEKFEGGTPHTAGIYGLLYAIKYLKKIGYKKIHEIEEANWKYFKHKFNEAKIKDLVWINQGIFSSIFLIKFNNIFSQDLAHYLGQHNIIVRSGLSCAKLMYDVIKEIGVVRISTSIYNTKDDIDYLFQVLANFKKEDVLNGII